MAVIACEIPNNDVKIGGEISCTSSTTAWVAAEGGENSITYMIKSIAPGAEVTAEADEAWIDITSIGDTAITYNVDANATGEERRAEITVEYGASSFAVTVIQSGEDATDVTTFEAYTLSGSEYYGIYHSDGYNYLVILSQFGFNEEGYLYSNSDYYYFDLYSDVQAEGDTATIPVGEYRLSTGTEPGAIYDEYSNLTVTSDYDYEEIFYKEAVLIVTETGIEAHVTLANGEVHHIVYEGSLEIPVYSEDDSWDDGYGFSTLMGDYSFAVEDGVFVGAYVGDLMGTGCNTCQIYLYESLDEVTGEEFGDTFQIDLQLPAEGTDICGTYVVGTAEGCFIAGSAYDCGDGQYMQENSWYIEAGYVNFAPLVDGEVKVEKDANDVYTFTLDCYDDCNNRISGTFSGRGEFIEW